MAAFIEKKCIKCGLEFDILEGPLKSSTAFYGTSYCKKCDVILSVSEGAKKNEYTVTYGRNMRIDSSKAEKSENKTKTVSPSDVEIKPNKSRYGGKEATLKKCPICSSAVHNISWDEKKCPRCGGILEDHGKGLAD